MRIRWLKRYRPFLTDEDYRLWYGRHAVEVLHQNPGALTRLLQLLQPYLPQRSHWMSTRLSVVMIAKNAADLLPDCPASVALG